jgi:uroporphyrinogen decarboxylase
MNDPRHDVRKAFEHQPPYRIPRGELWLGGKLFQKAGLEDTLQGHIALVKRLGQDVISLPISENVSVNKTTGYRSFSPKNLREAARLTDHFLMAIVDGPFQRLTEKHGLMKLLIGWVQGKTTVLNEYEEERNRVEHLLDRVLDVPVDAVIIAEDLAGEQGPLINPDEIRTFFAPFYTVAVAKSHNHGAYALLHSCGKITELLSQIDSCRFDGLAAIQHRANDLIALKAAYGSRFTIMAAIEADLLEVQKIPHASLAQYEKLLRSLASEGGFILCSSTGLYSGDFIERIQKLYGIADGLT